MNQLAGHLVVFVVVGVAALAAPLVLGALIRPRRPTPQKGSVYECGEPTVGSSYIQFDLRFYVVALLFIVFDVEVMFLFPWGLIFGTATQLADPSLPPETRMQLTERLLERPNGVPWQGAPIGHESALVLAWVTFADVLLFFAVLIVGFAYLWSRGDLDWVRTATNRAFVPPEEPDEALAS
jgi:NADH-quinone oxidoreductase subunit A